MAGLLRFAFVVGGLPLAVFIVAYWLFGIEPFLPPSGLAPIAAVPAPPAP